MMSVFETLNGLNVNEHTETKKSGGTELTYLSWPWAWAEVKKRYPEARYTIWKDAGGRPYAFDPLTGYMVYTSVTIGDESHDMWLPVMDGANNAMKAEPYEYKVKNPKFRYAKWNDQQKKYLDSYGNEQPEYLVKGVSAATMFDINKTIMRCLVKNLAMFGLGLYIYAGEDLPNGESDSGDKGTPPTDTETSHHGNRAVGDNRPGDNQPGERCVRCGEPINGVTTKNGRILTAPEIVEMTRKAYGAAYCYKCSTALKAAKAAAEGQDGGGN